MTDNTNVANYHYSSAYTTSAHFLEMLNCCLNRINILGSGPRMNLFNNRFYNGQCNRIREPSTLEYNRLPWNVGVLNYEVGLSFYCMPAFSCCFTKRLNIKGVGKMKKKNEN